MPGINPPNDEHLVYMIAEMRNQLRAVATNQQLVISNLQGEPILAFGLQPGSNPAEYGLGLLSQAFGSNLAFFGEDASGNVGLKYFDSTGSLVRLDNAAGTTWYNTAGYVIRQDGPSGTFWYDGTTADPTSANVTMSVTPANGFEVFNAGTLVTKTDSAGLHVYNASGVEEVAAGLLNASPAIYGLAVLPYGLTTMQQVGGVLGWVGGGGTATSSTQVSLTGTVTAEIGPSETALVTLSGSVENNGAAGVTDGYAYMGVSVDGAAATNWVNLQSNLVSSQITASLSSTQAVEKLTPGTHTFEAYGWVSSGTASGVYGNVALMVQPL